MGPIRDQLGVEQGGPNSSEQYKLYNNEQFIVAQESEFGVSIGPHTISSIGQADDSALTSSNFHQLAFLLKLTTNYCSKYQVEMTPEKTKLLIFSPNNSIVMQLTSPTVTTSPSTLYPLPVFPQLNMWE